VINAPTDATTKPTRRAFDTVGISDSASFNRGMSLEAIAALLGHRSPRMTMVYARISDTTVADQYFKATKTVEADSAALVPGQARSPQPRQLANGRCVRLSSRGESHPPALSEPGVNLSTHRAPAVRPAVS